MTINTPKLTDEEFEALFWFRVDKSGANGCWLWLGGKDKWGYGRIKRLQHWYRAPHLAWFYRHGHMPQPLLTCHRCDNPSCVNPDHLFLGTQRQNMDDMLAKGRQRDSRGTKNARVRLTPQQVQWVRAELANGKPCVALAKELGVVAGTIHHIKSGKNWQCLPAEPP